MNSTWEMQDAKRKFSKMIDQALTQGAQIITNQGKEMVVVIAFEEYERLRKPGSLAQFLLESPLADSDLTIERDQRPIR